MTPEQTESLLRKAPPVHPPSSLRAELEKTLPKPPSAQRRGTFLSRSWWPRWFPQAAWSLALAVAVGAIGYQTNRISDLRHANERLEAQKQEAEADGVVSLSQAEVEKLRLQARELERLQAELAEIEDLREEIALLKDEAEEVAALRDENQRLAQEAAAVAPTTVDFFGAAAEKANRIKCVNNLKNIGLAARIYATDHGDRFPTSVLDMTNELGTPKVLVCPSSELGKSGVLPQNWSEFSPSMVTYELFLTGDDDRYPQRVLSKCPIHRNYGLCNGSVHQNPTGPAGEINRELAKRHGLAAPAQSGPPYQMDPELARRYGLEEAPPRYREAIVDGHLTLVPNDRP